MKKRGIALLLLLGLLALPACRKKTEAMETGTTTTPSDTTVGAVETTKVEIPLALPEDLNYDGYTFTILTEEGFNWEEVDITEPKGTITNDTVVNDAITARNLAVEEQLGVKIKMLLTASSQDTIKKSVLAGDNAFDLAMPATRTAANLSLTDTFHDWHNLKYVTLSNPWYDQGVINNASIGGKIYFMTGDFGFRDKDNTWIFMYNKNLLKDLNMVQPYNLVRDGKWTLDVFTGLIKDVTTDLNGDGKYDKNDQFGFLTTGVGGATNFLYASGSKILDQNFELCLNTEKTAKIVEITHAIFNNKNQTHTDDWLVIEQMFAAGKGLFYSEIMAHVRNLRNMEADFGILPAPKYDEAQTNYYTHVDAATPMMCVPVTAPDLDRTSAVIEALSYYGQKYVKNAYYDVALTGKHVRDKDSAEMLDIILGGRIFDIGYLYNIGGFGDMMGSLIAKKSTDFSSYYIKNEAKATRELQKIIDHIDSLA